MSDSAKRLGYGDFLRCLATLAVVTLHCAGAALADQDPASRAFLGLNLLDGLCRWAVPMFVMLSGMFLLDPDRPMSRKKWLSHLGRPALATLVWGFFYGLWDARGTHFGAEGLLEGLISLVTGRLHYHLWFLPMLLGLYLLIPLLRALVRGASRRVLWGTAVLLEAAAAAVRILRFFFPNAFPAPWLGFLDLGTAAGYPGYFLLGYLLKTCRPNPGQERAVYALGAMGAAVTVWGTQVLSQAAGAFQNLFYSYFAPNVLLTAAALLLLVRRLDLGKASIWGRLSPLTFGVYLLHPLFLELVQPFLTFPNPVLTALVQLPAALAAALAGAWALRRVPRLGKCLC